MKIGITYRMFLAILTATFLAVVSMFFIMQWSLDRGFLRYVNSLEQKRITKLATLLEESYAAHGNWHFLRNDPSIFRRLIAATMPEDEASQIEREHREARRQGPVAGDKTSPDMLFPPPPPPHFSIHVVLLNAAKKPLFGSADFPANLELKPVLYKNQVVGYLGRLPRKNPFDVLQLQFIKQQKFALTLVAAVLLLLTAALSFPLASRIIRPIRALAEAARHLTAGRYDTRVPAVSSDELGQLARDFNTLALTLEKNEQARQQWVADISHELRTPLTILRGEVEAMQDGIRQADADSIQSLHEEILRLNRLVDDLYQLSMSDLGALTYRKEELDLVELLADTLTLYRQEFSRKNIALTETFPGDGKLMVFGDPERLRQLFTNLCDNALKYTDEAGRLVIRMTCHDNLTMVDIEDTAPGVAESELENLFERLYRVETSRNRTTGGAGLGLAICRNIVEAHGGNITAQPSPLGGIWIRVALPSIENC
jgi:two-component system, OmpR family, sensor histidine kinase BaeS